MFTHKVFDNFIPSYHQNSIEQQLSTMNWVYGNNISGVNAAPVLPEGVSLSKYQGGMAGNIYEKDKSYRHDIMFGLCLPLVSKVQEMIPFNLELWRIRAGMFFNHADKGIHNPHVDYYQTHYTLLYYVNDSDGDTFLFNEICKLKEYGVTPDYPDSFSLLANVSPIKGRAVLFNGLQYHASSLPVNHDTRIAININLAVVDK